MTPGERIKLLRIKKGMTQYELAIKLGYTSKTSVAHIENGRNIPRPLVVKLAELFDTTPAYLMGWEEDSPQGYDENEKIKDISKKLIKLSDSDLDKADAFISFLLSSYNQKEDIK